LWCSQTCSRQTLRGSSMPSRQPSNPLWLNRFGPSPPPSVLRPLSSVLRPPSRWASPSALSPHTSPRRDRARPGDPDP
jgi:hypothetical protein